ncbi:MAG: hypothetical protein PHV34_05830 [Verrucomicrobiae bacterium]|nr:hypothetical protein [Verrucomicrobiae bacterium]
MRLLQNYDARRCSGYGLAGKAWSLVNPPSPQGRGSVQASAALLPRLCSGQVVSLPEGQVLSLPKDQRSTRDILLPCA